MPTSMAIAPSFSHSALIKPGTPHAAITISAERTASSSILVVVVLKQTFTNALYLFNSRYIGIPTMFDLPIRVTLLPDNASVPPSSSFSMFITPRGVHETK